MLYLFYGPFCTWLISLIGLYFGFNVWFNHSMGMMVKPGNLKDYYLPEDSKSEEKRMKEDVLQHKNAISDGNDLKTLLKYSH